MSTNAVRRSPSSATRWSSQRGAQPTASSGASSARARRTWSVDVVDVGPARALAVRDARERARERRVLDVAEDGDVLPLLDVHADAQRETSVLLQLVGALAQNASVSTTG